MSEQLPSPDFDAAKYARPNANWICGRACDGDATCPAGPSRFGHCRAAAECSPVLEKKEGDAKGRWRCNRAGGACEQGPLPDGQCCRQTAPCTPARSLRGQRGRFTWVVIAATAAALLALIGGPGRPGFINPGTLSSPHSGSAFSVLHGGTNATDHTCAGCHAAGLAGPRQLIKAAFNAAPGPLEFHKLASITRTEMTAIDGSCQKCHANHLFHQPNVVRDHSCSLCHREHQGAGALQPPTDANCASCHGDAGIMTASAAKGATLAAAAFDFRPDRGQRIFKSARPATGGYTRLINHFATDHPEFQVLAENQREGNTLKFGHALHLTGDTVSFGDGRKLACADCHQPDAAGAYFRRINFEQHCRACHSLQFDPATPRLQLPHGNPAFVSAFLRSLGKQYADHARTNGLATGDAAVRSYTQERLQSLLGQFGTGEELERRVFFSTATLAPAVNVSTLTGQGRALYSGCAYCHEVKATGDASPTVTPPVIPDRWMIRGDFNHAKHTNMKCADCHAAEKSRDTADIILPSKNSCVTCHSPRGGVKDGCSTCHAYHTERREMVTLKGR
ncbi:MAG: hypothetical protein HY301_13635 [Verrucomicrobia bacterium]|nr:hypothetical protein [Verrucomicrobiota bacterium]